jgi:hypothetical protein
MDESTTKALIHGAIGHALELARFGTTNTRVRNTTLDQGLDIIVKGKVPGGEPISVPADMELLSGKKHQRRHKARSGQGFP